MKNSCASSPPLKVATGFYLFFSLLGVPLYMILPPVLTSVGARLHAYLLLTAAFNEAPPSVLLLLLIAVSHVLLLLIMITGIMAIVKGRFRLYSILVLLETVFTFAFLFCQGEGVYDFTAGIWVNLIYCIWLFSAVYVKS